MSALQFFTVLTALTLIGSATANVVLVMAVLKHRRIIRELEDDCRSRLKRQAAILGNRFPPRPGEG